MKLSTGVVMVLIVLGLVVSGCWVGYDTESVPLNTDGSSDEEAGQETAVPADTTPTSTDQSDACETCTTSSCIDLNTDPQNCGKCGMRCSGACVQGRCDCGADNPVPLYSDPYNCGRCDNDCTAAADVSDQSFCASGVCIYDCKQDFADCRPESGCETELTTDSRNCGGCGISCRSGTECQDGLCE